MTANEYGYVVSFQSDKNVLELVVTCFIADDRGPHHYHIWIFYNSMNILKAIELCTLKWWISHYINYILTLKKYPWLQKAYSETHEMS